MKALRSLLGFLCFLLLLPLFSLPALAIDTRELEVGATTAVLIDADTGQILYDKNMHGQRYPASITKIMTALLAVEHLEAGQVLTVSAGAISLPSYSTNASPGLAVGERLTVEDALHALLLQSANEAGNVLAEAVAGSQAAFVEMMNTRAKASGAQNTQFNNAHGLPDSRHYTTAYDMAMITREAVNTPLFMNYFGVDYYTIPATNVAEARSYVNYQSMLVEDSLFYYKDVIGGKVGYTDDAQHTMSTVARREGRTLICVVMGCSRDQKFTDTALLLDYGFDEFERHTISRERIGSRAVPVIDKETQIGRVDFSSEQDISFLLHNSISVDSIVQYYDLPESYTGGELLNASVSLHIPSPPVTGLPEVLLTSPLAPAVTLDNLPSGSKPVDMIAPEWLPYLTTSAVPSYLWIPLILSLVFLLRLLVKLVTWHRKVRRRRNRLSLGSLCEPPSLGRRVQRIIVTTLSDSRF